MTSGITSTLESHLNTPLLKGAIYCRVSTEDQESNGLSLPYQREASLKFAKENHLIVPDDFIFLEQYSGGFLDRPQLTKLFALASKNLIDFVIFTKRDRVARDQYVFQSIIKRLSDANVKVFYAEEKLTGDSAMDSFMGSTIIGFAAWEREQIKLRTNAGKRQHAKSGKWPFGGVPYGYMKNIKTKELEVHIGERDILLRIIHLYLEKDLSLGQIAKQLTDENVPPPTMSEKEGSNQLVNRKLRKNAVGFWRSMTLSRILSKVSIYTGVYQAFRKIYKKTGEYSVLVGERASDEWIEITIPRILSDKQATDVLEKLSFNKQYSKRKQNRTYLLQGKLKCDCAPELHGCMGYFNNRKNLRNYRCGFANSSKVSPERHCKNNISGMKIDTLVLETLQELCMDQSILMDHIAEQYGENKKDKKSGKTGKSERCRIHDLEGELLTLKDKRKRAEDLYIEGSISKERLHEAQAGLDEKKVIFEKELCEELELVQKESLSEQVQKEWGELMFELKEMIEYVFAEASYEELKKLFIETMVKRVILPTNKEDPVRIIIRFPCRIDIAARYLDSSENIVTHTDEQENTHKIISLGTHNKWRKFDLDPTKKPLTTRTVEWETEDLSDGNKTKVDLDGGDDIIQTVYTKIKEYVQSCNKYDQRKLKNYQNLVVFYIAIGLLRNEDAPLLYLFCDFYSVKLYFFVRFPYNPPHDSFIIGGFFKRPEVGKNSTILKRFIRCHLLT